MESEETPRHGFLEYRGACLNRSLAFSWKARATSLDILHWEMRHILPTLGYVETKNKRNNHHIITLYPKLEPVLSQWGLTARHHLYRGQLSETKRADTVVPDLSDFGLEASISTVSLIVLLLWCCVNQRGDRAAQVLSVTHAFLGMVLGLTDLNYFVVAPEDYADLQCSRRLPESACCPCMRKQVENAESLLDRDTEIEQLVGRLLCGLKSACPVVQHALHVALEDISCKVSANSEVWLTQDWENRKELTALKGPVKRKRVDLDLRALATQQLTEGKARRLDQAVRNIPGLSRSTTARWTTSDLNEYRSAGVFAFGCSRSNCISINVDCTRLGHPSKEYLIAVATDPASSIGVVCPPQVPCAIAIVFETITLFTQNIPKEENRTCQGFPSRVLRRVLSRALL
eukprot:6491179-Amphidinium_carterae.1